MIINSKKLQLKNNKYLNRLITILIIKKFLIIKIFYLLKIFNKA